MDCHTNGSATINGSATPEHGPGAVTSPLAVADPPGEDERELAGRLSQSGPPGQVPIMPNDATGWDSNSAALT